MTSTSFAQRMRNLASADTVADVTDDQADAILADAATALAEVAETNREERASTPIDYLADAEVKTFDDDKNGRRTVVLVSNSGIMSEKFTAKYWAPTGMSGEEVAQALAILAQNAITAS